MKIVFVSNFLNHHQLPVCLQFTEGNDFHFIATMPTPKAQVSLGYDDMNGVYDFVIKAYESHALKELAQRKIETADVVIAGSCAFPFEMIEKRLKEDKLTFWFSERLFKHSPLMRFYPPTVKRVLSQCTAYKANENFYLLAAGAYTAADYHYFQAFCGKSFKWGYFPANSDSLPEVIRQQKQKNTKLTLLWAGRFLPFKHPDYALYASHILTKAGIEHEVYMLGEGSLFDPIKQKVAKTGGGRIFLQGATPFRQVRNYMNAADIFLFTSDRREGWGAVLNESMDSACAVLANKQIGAAPYLITHGRNGIMYGSKRQFAEELLLLARDPRKRRDLGEAALAEIRGVWSAKTAAKNFLQIAEKLLGGCHNVACDVGPMSKT